MRTDQRTLNLMSLNYRPQPKQEQPQTRKTSLVSTAGLSFKRQLPTPELVNPVTLDTEQAQEDEPVIDYWEEFQQTKDKTSKMALMSSRPLVPKSDESEPPPIIQESYSVDSEVEVKTPSPVMVRRPTLVVAAVEEPTIQVVEQPELEEAKTYQWTDMVSHSKIKQEEDKLAQELQATEQLKAAELEAAERERTLLEDGLLQAARSRQLEVLNARPVMLEEILPSEETAIVIEEPSAAEESAEEVVATLLPAVQPTNPVSEPEPVEDITEAELEQDDTSDQLRQEMFAKLSSQPTAPVIEEPAPAEQTEEVVAVIEEPAVEVVEKVSFEALQRPSIVLPEVEPVAEVIEAPEIETVVDDSPVLDHTFIPQPVFQVEPVVVEEEEEEASDGDVINDFVDLSGYMQYKNQSIVPEETKEEEIETVQEQTPVVVPEAEVVAVLEPELLPMQFVQEQEPTPSLAIPATTTPAELKQKDFLQSRVRPRVTIPKGSDLFMKFLAENNINS